MGKRRKSRELALQVLYQLDINKQNTSQAFDQSQKYYPIKEGNGFAKQIVLGVIEHYKEIDQLIKGYSKNWRMDRMTVIDRNIIRMATFELLCCKDIPPKVTINEAIDLGKRFGSEDSGSFINGLLDRIQNDAVHKPLQPTHDEPRKPRLAEGIKRNTIK